MKTPSNLLNVVVDRWAATLGSTEFKIIVYLYAVAAAKRDGQISKSIKEIAEATNLAWRTVQAKLQDLDTRGVIEVISENKDRTLIQMSPQKWSLAVNNPNPTAEEPTGIPELIFRLCEQRPSPEMLTIMMSAADDDEQRLRHCLDSFFHQQKRWTTLELLTTAVQHDLSLRSYFDKSWGRP
jgi:hypothetical protein